MIKLFESWKKTFRLIHWVEVRHCYREQWVIRHETIGSKRDLHTEQRSKFERWGVKVSLFVVAWRWQSADPCLCEGDINQWREHGEGGTLEAGCRTILNRPQQTPLFYCIFDIFQSQDCFSFLVLCSTVRLRRETTGEEQWKRSKGSHFVDKRTEKQPRIVDGLIPSWKRQTRNGEQISRNGFRDSAQRD